MAKIEAGSRDASCESLPEYSERERGSLLYIAQVSYSLC